MPPDNDRETDLMYAGTMAASMAEATPQRLTAREPSSVSRVLFRGSSGWGTNVVVSSVRTCCLKLLRQKEKKQKKKKASKQASSHVRPEPQHLASCVWKGREGGLCSYVSLRPTVTRVRFFLSIMVSEKRMMCSKPTMESSH